MALKRPERAEFKRSAPSAPAFSGRCSDCRSRGTTHHHPRHLPSPPAEVVFRVAEATFRAPAATSRLSAPTLPTRGTSHLDRVHPQVVDLIGLGRIQNRGGNCWDCSFDRLVGDFRAPECRSRRWVSDFRQPVCGCGAPGRSLRRSGRQLRCAGRELPRARWQLRCAGRLLRRPGRKRPRAGWVAAAR